MNWLERLKKQTKIILIRMLTSKKAREKRRKERFIKILEQLEKEKIEVKCAISQAGSLVLCEVKNYQPVVVCEADETGLICAFYLNTLMDLSELSLRLLEIVELNFDYIEEEGVPLSLDTDTSELLVGNAAVKYAREMGFYKLTNLN